MKWLAAVVIALSANVAGATEAGSACATIHAIESTTLPPPGKSAGARTIKKFDFARTARCLTDEAGTRQAVLIALPADTVLQVTTATAGNGKKGMMPLAVSVLDAGRNLISHHAFETFLQRGTRFTYSFHRGVEHPGVYLLLEADRSVLGSSRTLVSGVSMSTVWIGGGFMGSYSDGHEQNIKMAMKESGKIDIEIERLESTH